jgi:hypothetical protein
MYQVIENGLIVPGMPFAWKFGAPMATLKGAERRAAKARAQYMTNNPAGQCSEELRAAYHTTITTV